MIKRVEIEGFGVIRSLFSLECTGGITLVKGENGRGKTTIFSAMVWCLYGQPLKDINGSSVATWKEKRTPDWRGTRVAVTLTAKNESYFIVRHLNYSGLSCGLNLKNSNAILIEKNGVLQEEKSKELSQEIITGLVGMSYDVFVKSVLFGQKMKRLIEEADKDKRIFFDAVFDLLWVDDAKEASKLLKAEKEVELSKMQSAITTVGSQIESYNHRIADAKERQELDKASKEHKISAIISTNDSLKSDGNLLVTSLQPAKDLLVQAEATLANEAVALTQSKEALTNSKASIQASINYILGQEIELKSKSLAIDAQLMEDYKVYEQEVNQYRQDQTKLIAGSEYILAKNAICEKLISDNIFIDTSIQEEEKQVTHYESLIKDYNLEVVKYKENISKLRATLELTTDTCTFCGQKLPEDRLLAEKHKVDTIDELQTKRTAIEELINFNKNNIVSRKGVIDSLNSRKNLNLEEHRLELEFIDKYTKEAAKSVENNIPTLSCHTLYASQYNAAVAERENIKKELLTLSIEKETLQGKLNAEVSEDTMQAYTNASKQVEVCRAAVQEIVTKIENIKVTLKNNDAQIQQIEQAPLQDYRIPEFELAIGELESSVISLREKATPIYEEYQALEFLADKVFTNVGIKSRVFQAMLSKLNTSINSIANLFNLSIEISIDLDKARSPVNTKVIYKGVTCSYEELSGGEQQRANTSIAFGCFLTIAANNLPILILDEVFEGLDEEGVDSVVKAISYMTGNSNISVYVISHLKTLSLPNSRILSL